MEEGVVYVIAESRSAAIRFAERVGLEPGLWIYLHSVDCIKGLKCLRYTIVDGCLFDVKILGYLKRKDVYAEYVGKRQLSRESLVFRCRKGVSQ